MPTENVLIRKCIVYHAHGGFVIGSEMSGGVRNIRVDDCTFVGTDVGLRFKTTRGRGGIVENIYVNNIVMKDIVGEAILFDMYYAAQDPIALAGEKREAPKVETLPVTEGTPQFRKIYIKNIVCNGASKAIFVRGLPEMNVIDVSMENMVIQANEGLDCTAGAYIQLTNVALLTTNTNPVMKFSQSHGIVLDRIKYTPGAELLVQVTGKHGDSVTLKNTDLSKTKQPTKAIVTD